MRPHAAVVVLPLVFAFACKQQPPAASPTTASPEAAQIAPQKPTREDVCRDAARACGKALFSHDYDGLVGCMPKEVFDAFPDIGGREGFRAIAEREIEKMAKDGFTIESVDFDPPHELKAGGSGLFAIVPQTVTLKAPQGHLVQHSFMIGVSRDGGDSWKFVDGAIAKKAVKRLFPEFPPDLTLPDLQKPVLGP